MQPDYRLLDSSLTRMDAALKEKHPWRLPKSQRPGLEVLSQWIEAFGELQQMTGDMAEFFQQALRSIISPGGFEAAEMIFLDDSQSSLSVGSIEHFDAVRQRLIAMVNQENTTCFHRAALLDHESHLWGLPTAVISPLHDHRKNLIGYLIGWRVSGENNQRLGVRSWEAHFVRMISQLVSCTGIRFENVRESTKKTALLAQVFPEKVIEQWEQNPGIFEAREQVVTTMIVDVRDFSRISDRFPPQQAYRLVNELMEHWTMLVLQNSGVIVDYFGDGLLAFWNAPLEIRDHASMAVNCAMQIQDDLAGMGQKWESILEQPLRAGIGIATGPAHVGNCGSPQRIKYGPHGRSVNLAARLEQLTKQLAMPIVISELTAEHINADFLTRRICKVRIRGFRQALNIYEPIPENSDLDFCALEKYEDILQQFETRNLEISSSGFQALLNQFPNDIALQRILTRMQKSDHQNSKTANSTMTFLRDSSVS